MPDFRKASIPSILDARAGTSMSGLRPTERPLGAPKVSVPNEPSFNPKPEVSSRSCAPARYLSHGRKGRTRVSGHIGATEIRWPDRDLHLFVTLHFCAGMTRCMLAMAKLAVNTRPMKPLSAHPASLPIRVRMRSVCIHDSRPTALFAESVA